MGDLNGIASLLKNSRTFAGLDDTALQAIATQSEEVNYASNAVILQEGEFADLAYILMEGSCEVFKVDRAGNELHIATLEAGDFFGELSLLTNTYRNASVKAITPCRLLKISKEAFKVLLTNHASLSQMVIKVLSNRLVTALHLVTRDESNVVVVLRNHDESQKNLNAFINYFQQIAPRPITLVEGDNSFDVIHKITHEVNNHFILVKTRQKIEEEIAHHTMYIVDFIEPVHDAKHYYIPDDAKVWHIEHIVRRITKKTIGLALCSGGAPGIAHMGVLKVLMRENIPLDYIVGTSAGAICGGCYAFGNNLDESIEIIKTAHQPSMFSIALHNLSFNLTGIMSGKFYVNLFQDLFQEKTIEQAHIPFAAVASDLLTGSTVVFREGSAVLAVRASCSVPLLMSPIKYGDKLLVDGVSTQPLPVYLLNEKQIDIKIAVPIPQLELHSSINMNAKLLGIYLRQRSMMAEEIVNSSMELADIIIQPEVEGIRLLDWKQLDKVVAAGEEAANKNIARIKHLLGITNKKKDL